MALRTSTERRQFDQGWISDVARNRGFDAFRLPKNIWESPVEVGALESSPGRLETADATLNISAMYKATDSVTGTVLRIVQEDTAIKVLSATGTIGATLKSGLTAGTKVSFCVMGDLDIVEHIFCYNGVDTPFKIRIDDQTVSDIGLTTPDLEQGSTSIDTGTATTASSIGTLLIDSAATFKATGVLRGDLVKNTTDGSLGVVYRVDSETQILMSALLGGTDNDWDVPDAYTITRALVTGTPVASGTDNNVVGLVRYWIAELSESTESALSAPTSTVDAGEGNEVTLTFPNDSEFNSKTFKIYRTHANEATPFEVGQVDIGATGGTFLDQVADAALGGPPFLHGEQPPPGATACISYFSRIYLLVGNTIYFSDLGAPESFFVADGGNWFPVGHNDGDLGTALARDVDGFLVWKRGHLYKIYGRQPEEFQVAEIVPTDQATRSVGTPGTTSFTYTSAGILFYFNLALYIYNDNRVKRISDLIESDIQELLGSGDFAETGNWDVVAAFTSSNGRAWISLNTSNEAVTLFYDVNLKRFVGAMESGYRCYLVNDIGLSSYAAGDKYAEYMYLGGSTGNPASDSTKIYRVRYDETLARDQSFVMFPAGGQNREQKRFLDLVAWFRNDTQPLEADFLIKVDGVTAQSLLDVQVDDGSAARARAETKVYIGSEGHDGELSLTMDSATNGVNPMTLYAVDWHYQIMRIGTGGHMTA